MDLGFGQRDAFSGGSLGENPKGFEKRVFSLENLKYKLH
jgi:hypothetical protein